MKTGFLNTILLVCSVHFLVVPNFRVNAQEVDTELTRLLDEIWDFELTERPLLATDVGDHRGQDRLADRSLAAIDRRARKYRDCLDRLKTIDRRSVSAARQIDYEIVRLRLVDQVADHGFQLHLMPIDMRSGFHISFPELAKVMNPKSERDFDNYIA